MNIFEIIPIHTHVGNFDGINLVEYSSESIYPLRRTKEVNILQYMDINDIIFQGIMKQLVYIDNMDIVWDIRK